METICAIATPSGGALGIIRVSGPEAINITASIFTPKGNTPLTDKKVAHSPLATSSTPLRTTLLMRYSSVYSVPPTLIQAKIAPKFHVMVLTTYLIA